MFTHYHVYEIDQKPPETSFCDTGALQEPCVGLHDAEVYEETLNASYEDGVPGFMAADIKGAAPPGGRLVHCNHQQAIYCYIQIKCNSNYMWSVMPPLLQNELIEGFQPLVTLPRIHYFLIVRVCLSVFFSVSFSVMNLGQWQYYGG